MGQSFSQAESSLIDRLDNAAIVCKLSHALAGRILRGASIFLGFNLRSADHTTWLGNVYGQSHSSRISLPFSGVVISYVYIIYVKYLRC